MKRKTKVFLFLILAFFSWLLILSQQSFTPPESKEIQTRINYLKRVIYEPLDQESDIIKLSSESSEFILFSFAFSSYAMTNLATKDSTYLKEAVPLIKESISKVLDTKVSSTYGIYDRIDTLDSLAEVSVLYMGHLNLMIGCYRLLSRDTSFNSLNNRISKSLFQRYSKTPFLNLESYPGSIWIPDNTVALASLKLHDHNSGSNYDKICLKWIEYAKQNFLEPETEVLYSTVDPQTGDAIEEARGSMLGWSMMFIYQFDSVFAQDLYKNYKDHFSDNIGVYQLFKERNKIRKSTNGDIDSGPILFGYSIPANQFALANALLAKDLKTAKKLERLINTATKKTTKNEELKYKVRFLEMNISPMAEAMMLNSLTIKRWVP